MRLRLLVISAVAFGLWAGAASPASATDFEEPMTDEDIAATETSAGPEEWECGGGSDGPVTSSSAARLSAASDDCADRYYCRRVDVARVHRSLLGFVVFKFWHWKRWCYRYPRIRSVRTGTYVTNVDPNYQYGGITASWQHYFVWCCNRRDSGHVSHRQARFDNCVAYIGCLSSVYPWVRIRARANGSYTYRTGT